MSDTWTPGPWFAVNDGSAADPMMMVKAARIAGRPPRHEVAIVATGDSPQEMENANARLIAAAPDMVEALEACIDALRDLGAHQSPNMIGAAALTEARAALAKARGQA